MIPVMIPVMTPVMIPAGESPYMNPLLKHWRGEGQRQNTFTAHMRVGVFACSAWDSPQDMMHRFIRQACAELTRTHGCLWREAPSFTVAPKANQKREGVRLLYCVRGQDARRRGLEQRRRRSLRNAGLGVVRGHGGCPAAPSWTGRGAPTNGSRRQRGSRLQTSARAAAPGAGAGHPLGVGRGDSRKRRVGVA